ncbi:hypothetical protein TRAPUB_1449 [Trametes pubescens]|uniref:Uncharacterized protein n=1 Tax=Trametes pubescens TaxID=154538 RepID=A0A1M2VJE6_TRAPU|nr:hypothetical protein TRAPUB_1449 [Trametes pubescens]
MSGGTEEAEEIGVKRVPVKTTVGRAWEKRCWGMPIYGRIRLPPAAAELPRTRASDE